MTSVCPEPGCPQLTPCPTHPPVIHRSPSSKRTGRRDWQATRQHILTRDKHRCQLNLPGCTRHATQVDHRIPVSRGGTDAEGNLVAACAHCNNRRGNRTEPTSRKL